jgi:hypothetical protein
MRQHVWVIDVLVCFFRIAVGLSWQASAHSRFKRIAGYVFLPLQKDCAVSQCDAI